MVCGNIFKVLSIPNHKSWGAEMLRKCSPPTMCQMSRVIYHVSGVRCQVSGVRCDFFFIFINFNRPRVAGAVLQSPPSLINSLSDPLVQNLQDTVNTKLLELGSWNFEKMFTPHHVSHVRCQVSSVRCHMSRFRCHMSGVTCHFLSDKVVGLVGGGSVINGAWPV